MESTGSLFLAAITGMLLLLLFIGLAVAIANRLKRSPNSALPLIPSADGCFDAADKRISCAHCGGIKFKAQEILLNTWLLSLLRIDWRDSSATARRCENCGKITWFSQSESGDDK